MNLKVRHMVLTSVFVAMGVILPFAFHGIAEAGKIFLPMHIPVLICGLLCGWYYGLFCGILTPLLSHLFTQMPPAPILPSMLCELAVYGLVAGLVMMIIKSKKTYIQVYSSLIIAMLCGRIVSGIANAFIFNTANYSIQTWLTAAFITAIPGIIIQIVIVPILYMAVKKVYLR